MNARIRYFAGFSLLIFAIAYTLSSYFCGLLAERQFYKMLDELSKNELVIVRGSGFERGIFGSDFTILLAPRHIDPNASWELDGRLWHRAESIAFGLGLSGSLKGKYLQIPAKFKGVAFFDASVSLNLSFAQSSVYENGLNIFIKSANGFINTFEASAPSILFDFGRLEGLSIGFNAKRRGELLNLNIWGLTGELEAGTSKVLSKSHFSLQASNLDFDALLKELVEAFTPERMRILPFSRGFRLELSQFELVGASADVLWGKATLNLGEGAEEIAFRAQGALRGSYERFLKPFENIFSAQDMNSIYHILQTSIYYGYILQDKNGLSINVFYDGDKLFFDDPSSQTATK